MTSTYNYERGEGDVKEHIAEHHKTAQHSHSHPERLGLSESREHALVFANLLAIRGRAEVLIGYNHEQLMHSQETCRAVEDMLEACSEIWQMLHGLPIRVPLHKGPAGGLVRDGANQGRGKRRGKSGNSWGNRTPLPESLKEIPLQDSTFPGAPKRVKVVRGVDAEGNEVPISPPPLARDSIPQREDSIPGMSSYNDVMATDERGIPPQREEITNYPDGQTREEWREAMAKAYARKNTEPDSKGSSGSVDGGANGC